MINPREIHMLTNCIRFSASLLSDLAIIRNYDFSTSIDYRNLIAEIEKLKKTIEEKK
jgi:hypothetical protein